MANVFPRRTVELRVETVSALRRFTFSLVEMAILTGLMIRMYRVITIGHGSSGWVYIGGTVALGTVILLGMVTAHLANFPLHQWMWRTFGFILVEVAAEGAAAALLIAAGREPIGSVRAHFGDLPAIISRTLMLRGLAIGLWVPLLAGVVHVVRNRFVREDVEPIT